MSLKLSKCGRVLTMKLIDLWLEHASNHNDAQIECRICLLGNYREHHICQFINKNVHSALCADLIRSPSASVFNSSDLIRASTEVSTQEKISEDAHFYYFCSLILTKEQFQVAEDIRVSTTNRYSTSVPNSELLEKYRIRCISGYLYRGMRVDFKIFQEMTHQSIGDEFIARNPILSTTSLFGRGLDYSYRRRPLDSSDTNSGILIRIEGAFGLPIASLSTYPKEREWRITGDFVIANIELDVHPSDYYNISSDWMLENWAAPIEKMENWGIITLRANVGGGTKLHE